MLKIKETLTAFVDAIDNKLPVVVDGHGGWEVEGFFKNQFRRFCGLEKRRLSSIAREFISLFDELETNPLLFNNGTLTHDYLRYVIAAKHLYRYLDEHNVNISELRQLQIRMIGLEYRLEVNNGGINPKAPRYTVVDQLIPYLIEWKERLEIFHSKEITPIEYRLLENLSRYWEFSDLVLMDEALREAVFLWGIRDLCPIRVFIEYPALKDVLVDSALNGRIGRMGGETVLQVVKIPVNDEPNLVKEKVVTLPFEGKPISILDPARAIVFRGNYRLTLAEVFDVFKYKYLRVGNLEFMSDGIINWNIQKCGWWNADKGCFEVIDIIRPDWWKQLPFFEILSKEQAQEHYDLPMDGVNWVAAATATRGTATLDYDQTHAFLEVAIPTQDANYAIVDFGKLANEFPGSFFQTLKMFAHSVHATVAFPDENVFYSHRQHAQHSFLLTPSEGMRMMESIKRDMISARAFNFVYQIESENCAKWVHEKLVHALGKDRVPDMFKISIMDTEPHGGALWLWNLVRALPQHMQIPVMTFLHLPFGAYKGNWAIDEGKMVWRSLTNHHFWETGIVYLPALLIQKKSLGVLESIASIYNKLTFAYNKLKHMAYYQMEKGRVFVGSCWKGKVVLLNTFTTLSCLRQINQQLIVPLKVGINV